MIARLLLFVSASLVGSTCLSGELTCNVRHRDRCVFKAQSYVEDVDTLLQSNLSKVTFRRAEYTSPYRDSLPESHVHGCVCFGITGLPEIEFQGLRFARVAEPESGHLEKCKAIWKLHPDDVSLIAAHFEPRATECNYDYFTLRVNGIEGFTGALFEKPATDDIAGSLLCARVIASRHLHQSMLKPIHNPAEEDLSLTGRIAVTFNGLPAMQLKSLRLIYMPGETLSYKEGSAWTLHPDDAAKIVSHYRPILDQQRRDTQLAAWNASVPFVGRGITLVLLTVLLLYIVQNRIARQLNGSQKTDPKPSWLDD